MSFLAAAGSIAAAEALAAAAMAGTTAAQVAAAAVAAQAATAATAAGTAMAATIPTAAGIGGAMPSTASLLSGAATGIAPGVVPVGGLGALPTVAATVAPVVAEESIKQLVPKAGSIPSVGNIAKPPIIPQASPRTGSTSIRPADVVKAPTPKSTAYLSETPLQPSPMNAGRGGLGSVEPSLNTSVTNLSRPVNEAGTDLMMKSIADSTVHRTPLQKAGDFVMDNKMNIALGGLGLMQMMPPDSGVNPISEDMIRPYTYSEEDTSDQEADPKGREKIRYSGSYTAGTPYKAAQGGLLSLHRGGNFLSGRGDGMSDDIPAMIGTKQPARLADGEFVIPADVVSHIGNGSSKAGAEKLYAMMDKIRQERTGRKRQSPQINAAKYLPR